MLVCHCNTVSDRAIRKAIREGASNVTDIGFASGAGTCCGGCIDTIHDILGAEATQGEAQAVTSLPVVQKTS